MATSAAARELAFSVGCQHRLRIFVDPPPV
jgi:hypothetical protein